MRHITKQNIRRCLQLLPLVIGLWLLGCGDEAIVMPPTLTPIAENPQVISPIVSGWEYLSPRDEQAFTRFPVQNREAIEFGPGNYEAYIIWREGGFDLIWGGFFCSLHPILVIDEATIALWQNDGIWEDCIASQEIHAFKVELETNIPPNAWRYEFHTGAPP